MRHRCECGHRAHRHGSSVGCTVDVVAHRPMSWIARRLRCLFPVKRKHCTCRMDAFEVGTDGWK